MKNAKLTVAQTCMTANFYEESIDHPKETFEQITRRCLGAKGFRKGATEYKKECRKAFDLGRKK
jgi:hypothetical protein